MILTIPPISILRCISCSVRNTVFWEAKRCGKLFVHRVTALLPTLDTEKPKRLTNHFLSNCNCFFLIFTPSFRCLNQCNSVEKPPSDKTWTPQQYMDLMSAFDNQLVMPQLVPVSDKFFGNFKSTTIHPKIVILLLFTIVYVRDVHIDLSIVHGLQSFEPNHVRYRRRQKSSR